MDVINAKSNTYPFVEVVIYSEILRTNCRMNQSSSHLATILLFGRECPKEEIVFLCQVIILYTVIVVSIYNLTVAHDDSTLWTAMLSSSLGYLLPNPSLKR